MDCGWAIDGLSRSGPGCESPAIGAVSCRRRRSLGALLDYHAVDRGGAGRSVDSFVASLSGRSADRSAATIADFGRMASPLPYQHLVRHLSLPSATARDFAPWIS